MQTISERPAHGKRLNRAIVVEAALELVDREGLAALNLRRLGSELGASAMAPYSYFSGKEALIDAMLESAVGGLEAQLDPGDPWDAQVEESMVALHEALSRHPGVAELIAARSEGQRLIELRDALLAAVQRAGLDEPESADALRALMSYVLGFFVLSDGRRPAVSRGSPQAFEYGLGMLMDSFKRRVPTAPVPRS